MLFLDKYRFPDKTEFANKVKQIASALNVKPDWLMAVMYFESGLNPQSQNNIGAGGLIGFLPKTASGFLNTTIQHILSLGATSQLDYVYKFYNKWKAAGAKIKRFEDLYILTFYPYALIKNMPDSYIIGSEVSQQYVRDVASANPIFNPERKSYITLGDVRKALRKKYSKYPQLFSGNKETVIIVLVSVLIVILALGFATNWRYFGLTDKIKKLL